LDEVCVDSECGDGFVDTVLGEVCDDANDVAGDGCESSCERSCTPQPDTCDDGNPCNGVETCGSAFFCVAGTPRNCNDNYACSTDTCDPVLLCVYRSIDADGDGQSPSALGSCGTDCNDNDPAVHVGAADACDGIDNDCDNVIDEGGVVTWWVDCDRDGYASFNASSVQSCARPTTPPTSCASGTWVSVNPQTSPDCNDASSGVRPGLTEVVGDEIDQNCDGRETCYLDADGDNYRLTTTLVSNDADCGDAGEGSASDPTGDCNDSLASVNPSAPEITGNQRDENCDGRENCYRDTDNDGYRTTSIVSSADVDCSDSGEAPSTDPGSDCCDTDADARPGQTGWFDLADGPTACGGWDYDCSGNAIRRWTTQENVCGYNVPNGCGTPASDAGWVTLPGVCPLPMAPMPAPECGTPMYCWADNCHQTGPTSCSFDFEGRMQQCH
jgi:cysteine-rich repeat protein